MIDVNDRDDNKKATKILPAQANTSLIVSFY